jgi:hypothetical protein
MSLSFTVLPLHALHAPGLSPEEVFVLESEMHRDECWFARIPEVVRCGLYGCSQLSLLPVW